MNHNCHGDWWPKLNVYRCLADSTLVHRSEPPETCPACGRKADPICDPNATLERYVIEVIYSSDGHSFELDRRPLQQQAPALPRHGDKKDSVAP